MSIGLGHICFITPNNLSISALEEMVCSVLGAGVRCIQYRDKDRTAEELYAGALRLREITGRYNARLIINDRADIALAVNADGVHLGQEDLPLSEARKIMGNRIIGISTHNVAEAVAAEKGGADYIGFGSIFPTDTKDVGAIQGVDPISVIKQAVGIPVIAIGGIKVENAGLVFKAGADGVAVSSGLTTGDLTRNASAFLALFP